MGVEIDDSDLFEGMTEEFEEDVLKELHRTAEDMVAISKAMAPRESGALAEGMRVERIEGQLAVRVVAAEGDKFYGVFQEKGTEKMDENPYFEPARDSVADAFEERMADIAERRS